MSEAPRYRKEVVIGRVAAFFYRLYAATFRYRMHTEDPETLELVMKDLAHHGPNVGRNVIYAFWHQDELSLLPYFANRHIVAMVSDSRDGTIMATALESLGYLTTRGSSTRGGVKAFVASLRMIKKGYHFTAAVDGPRGPIFKTKEGVIRLSEKSGRPILPLRAWPKHYIPLWTAWNKGKVPLPFSKIHVVIGRPERYSRDDTDEVLNSLVWPPREV